MATKKFKTASVGTTVYEVRVDLNALMETQKSKVEPMKVIGLSQHFICLDGDLFPKLAVSKTFDTCHSKLESISISEKTSAFDIEYFGKFTISLYTTEPNLKRVEMRINREFKGWLNKKIGAYGQAMDVNISLDNKAA